MDLLLLFPLAEATASAGGEAASFPGVVGDVVALLKAGGPLALAVLAGYWAVLKDREKNEVQEKAAVAAKAAYDQMVALVAAQTTAMVKMEATLASLLTVIAAQDRRRDRERGT